MEPENRPVRLAAGLGVAAGPREPLAADYDLLLSIFPFEKDWYAKRVPKLRVEFVGHPMMETNAEVHESESQKSQSLKTPAPTFCFCRAAARASCNGICR